MSSGPGGGCYIIRLESLERLWGDAEEKSSLLLAPGWGVKENAFSPIHPAVMPSVSSGPLQFGSANLSKPLNKRTEPGAAAEDSDDEEDRADFRDSENSCGTKRASIKC